MFSITANQVAGILRAVLPPIVAYIAAKGWIAGGANVDAVVTAIVTIVTAAWSFHSNKETPK